MDEYDNTLLDELALEYAHTQKYMSHYELNKILEKAASYGYSEKEVYEHCLSKGFNK